MKFDRQIVAIAKVMAATEIYSDDADVARLAKQVNIKCIGVVDLPLPNEAAQFKLDLEGHADAPINKTAEAEEEGSGATTQSPS